MAKRVSSNGRKGLSASELDDRSKACIRIEGLRIDRNDCRIIRGLNWSVGAGEHWCILGANGSGKTSLLRALAGYFMPTAGEIFLLGSRYGEADWREVRLKLGIVSSAVRQMMADAEPAIHSVVSGRYAMIDYWGKPKEEDLKIARRILRQVECGGLANRPWGHLSQGERQRVLIGRALMAQPPVLILDEPCAGLDPGARENFLQFLDRLGSQASAPTLVLVTHHVEEIMPTFSHVLMLKSGKKLCAGRKREVMTSANLSQLFSTSATLRSRGGRYRLTVRADKKRVT